MAKTTPRVWTPSSVLEAIRHFLLREQRWPRELDYRRCNGLPAYSTVLYHLKTIEVVHSALGARTPPWTREAQLSALRAFVQAYGQWPTEADCGAQSALPSYEVIRRQFGGLPGYVAAYRERYGPLPAEDRGGQRECLRCSQPFWSLDRVSQRCHSPADVRAGRCRAPVPDDECGGWMSGVHVDESYWDLLDLEDE